MQCYSSASPTASCAAHSSTLRQQAMLPVTLTAATSALCPSVGLGWAACLSRVDLSRVCRAAMGGGRASISTSAVAAVEPCLQAPELEAPQQPSRLAAWAQQLRGRPAFHVQPLHQGWINDPNGIHWDPRTQLYHMFYQHFETGCQWQWGLSWGHACSQDLLTWHHLPPILQPSPGSEDADGVWSGCAFPTDEGTVLLNTAVRLRATTAAHLLPPADQDLGLQMIESQCYATADSRTDPLLQRWTKGAAPMLPLPPSSGLTGWRDPFLVGRPGDGQHDRWTMLVGAGHTGGAGTALVYTSDSPTHGWELQGELCSAPGFGSMWECPLLAPLAPRSPSSTDGTDLVIPPCDPLAASNGNGSQPHLLVVCPDNAHHAPVYFIGDYDAATLKFDLPRATPGVPLDLGGPTFYAPNLLMNDPHGRLVMWGWCQELGRPAGEYAAACCLSQPRLVSLQQQADQPPRVWQEPLPALSQLRTASWVSGGALHVQPGSPLALTAAADSAHCEIEVTLQRPHRHPRSRVCKTALLLRPDGVDAAAVPVGEASGQHGAALLFDWDTRRLEVVYSDGSLPLDKLARLPADYYQAMNSASSVSVAAPPPPSPVRTPAAAGAPAPGVPAPGVEVPEFDEDEMDVERRALNIAGCHMVGGVLHLGDQEEALQLRVFMDHSLMEVFTSTGQVLTTRVYPTASVAGVVVPHTVCLASFGCTSHVSQCAVHHMDACWESPEALQQLEQRLTHQAATTPTAAAAAAGRLVGEAAKSPARSPQPAFPLGVIAGMLPHGSPVPSPRLVEPAAV